MKSWLMAHAQALHRALRHLARQPAVTTLSVLVIGIALALPLSFQIFIENTLRAVKGIDTDPQLNIYLQTSASLDEARQVETRLKSNPAISSVRFISREAALQEMKSVGHLTDLLVNLDSNPLPHAFSVRPKSSQPGDFTALRTTLLTLPKVEFVVADFEWAQKWARFATFAERLVWGIAILLAGAVVFVTGNTIRLQIFTRRDEIEVSRLIGATRRFIRRPFLYFGAIQGLLAGCVALVIVAGGLYWIAHEVQALTIVYLSDLSIKIISLERATGVLVGAAALGWLGALISVSFYLGRQP